MRERGPADAHAAIDWATEVRRRLPAGIEPDAERAIEEIAQHLAARYEEALRADIAPAAARQLALEELAEWTPATRWPGWAARSLGALYDLRQGPRVLRREPLFAATVIAILGGALAVTLALFAVVDVLLLKPLPLPQAERLLLLGEGVPALGYPKLPFSPPDFQDLRAGQRSYSHVAAYICADLEGYLGQGEARRVHVTRATASLFDTLGVGAHLGRVFDAREEREGARVVVLTEPFWRRHLGADPGVLGRRLQLDREAYTVIGVLPPGLRFPLPGPAPNGVPADVYLPLTFTPEELAARGAHFNHSVLARLAPGASLTTARAELATLAAASLALYPAEVRAALGGAPLVPWARALREEVTGPSRPAALLLLGAVALLLLIGCANVANLMLVRALSQRRELAVRAALGAARLRLLMPMLAESAMLALAAAGVGLLGAWGLTRTLPALLPLPIAGAPPIDGRVVLVGLLLAASSTLGAGLLPALVGTGHDPIGALRDGRSAASPSRRRWQRAFVVAQLAVALVLLVAAGLLTRSLANLLNTDPGFRPDRLASASIALPAVAYPRAADVRALYARLLANASAEPGLEAVALGSDLPLASRDYSLVHVESRTTGQDPSATSALTWTSGAYLETLGIPLRRGRLFDERDDAAGQPVALVNEAFARRYWPGREALGQRLRRRTDEPWATVIGVVGDAKDAALWAPAEPHVYWPFAQAHDVLVADDITRLLRTMTLVARASVAAEDALPTLRRSVRSVDPQLAPTDVQVVGDTLVEATYTQRASSAVLAIFAAAASLLAAVGLYGLVAYQVALRRRELGVRTALGADARRLVRLLGGEGLRLALLGVALGTLLADAGSRLLGSLLHGVSAADPLVYVTTAVLLIAVASLAAWLPARRAARIDVCASLRAE
jgi:putative ABC transport system permease protein